MTQTQMHVGYNYLREQFVGTPLREAIDRDMAILLDSGDFTLGSWVYRFEDAFAEKLRVKHAIGVSNGTDALFLAMKACGWGGEAIVTPPNSFLATTGAIVQLQGQPVFLDVGADYLLDYKLGSYKALTVDLTGNVSPMDDENVVHDAAQAVGAEYKDKSVAAMGAAACFSLHPLKNINVGGDGGVVTTNSDETAERIRLLRNHGLQDRDTCVIPGYNHRLSTMQAMIAYHVLQDLDWITDRRIANAARYDEGLKDCPGIIIPPRDPDVKQVYHTYVVQAQYRDTLIKYLGDRNIEAKVHYPVPIHLQPGYAYLGYKEGDFPVCEAQAKRIISLPIHQYLTEDQIDYTIETIRGFYRTDES